MDRWIRIAGMWIRSLVRGRGLDDDVDEELRDYLARETEANLARGMSPADAERAARLTLGGLPQQKEVCRDARGLRWLQEAGQDARYAWRTYRKSPAFTTTALLTVSLAIGSNTAIFSLVNALFLRELPVSDPGALVKLQTVPRDGPPGNLSYDAFRLLSGRLTAFSALIGWSGPSVEAIDVNGRIDRAAIFGATSNTYDMLGVQAIAGRLLAPTDMSLDPARAERVAILGYTCWQRLFGGSRAAIGQVVRIQTVPFTVVGVTPPRFTGLGLVVEPDITIPITALPLIDGRPVSSLPARANRWITTIGRLRPRERLTEARAELNAVWPSVRADAAAVLATPAQRDDTRALGIVASSAATGIEPNLRKRYTRPLAIVMAIALLLMSIASLNFAGLVLARTASRQREFGVRLALGAGAARVARQLLTEALLLALVGMLGGLLIAKAAAKAIAAVLLRDVVVPIRFDASPDGRVFAFAGALALVTAIVVSLAPYWRVVRRSSATCLRHDTRTTSAPRGVGLSVAQIAVTVVLVMTASLLVRTLQKLRDVEPGFDVEGVEVVYPDPVPGGYTNIQNDTYLPALVARIGDVPGVTDVSVTLMKPGGRFGPQNVVAPADVSNGAGVPSYETPISPGFFRTLGIRVVQGRDFAWTDNSRGRPVAIVSRSLARRLFGSGNAIRGGVRIGARPPYREAEIIGVVDDARLYDMRSSNLCGLYTAALQQGDEANYKALLVRASPAAMPQVRRAVRSLDRDQVLAVTSVAFEFDQAILPERLAATFAGFFGLFGLAVAGVGLYGRMSYDVTRREREIGIRMALGAEWRRVVSDIVRDGLIVCGAGAAIGLVAGLFFVRFVRSLLFGIGPYDPLTLGASIAVLLMMSIVACARPAIRAGRLDPLDVLRQE
jgi:predicted permease